MGTNYYLERDFCHDCGRSDQYHIGKASAGWRFLFRGYEPGDGPAITNGVCHVSDWKRLTDNPFSIIRNEYGDEVSCEDFWEMVEEIKGHPKSNLTPGEDFTFNEFT